MLLLKLTFADPVAREVATAESLSRGLKQVNAHADVRDISDQLRDAVDILNRYYTEGSPAHGVAVMLSQLLKRE